MPKCPPTGGVRLQEVPVSGGSTLHVQCSSSRAGTNSGNVTVNL